MEVFLDFDAPVLAALPVGYLVAVPVLEGLVLCSGLLALLMAAGRLTWLHPVACSLVLAELGVLVSTRAEAGGLVLVVASAVAGTAAAVAGERGRVRHQAVAVTASLALLYPVAGYLAVLVGFGVGAFPLALNGGTIDYDGLPIFLAGPFSAAFPVLLYLAGTEAFGSTVEPRDRDDPSAEHADAPSEVAGRPVG
jgi:hypothetical protein